MNEFFLLDTGAQITLPEEFSGYIIFYKKSEDEKIKSVQNDLLEKLIQNALKLKMQNFLCVDVRQNRIRIAGLKKTMPVKKCLLFGVKEREVGINFDVPLYQLTHVSGIDFIKADSPEILELNKNLKNKLWSQLQIAFKPQE